MFKKYLKKITRLFFANIWELSPPYDYAQDIVLFNLHKYLNTSASDIKRLCMVGGYKGYEIPTLLKNYPEMTLDVFECSNRYYHKLAKKFDSEPRVTTVNKAVSNTEGEFTFYETNLTGSGSLLQVGELATKSYGTKQEESFTVETTTLDKYYNEGIVDVLWVDVQGAEKLVLEGASNTLKKTKAIFIEVSVLPNLYKNGTTLDEITSLLAIDKFELAIMGLGEDLTGNAFFIKRDSAT